MKYFTWYDPSYWYKLKVIIVTQRTSGREGLVIDLSYVKMIVKQTKIRNKNVKGKETRLKKTKECL